MDIMCNADRLYRKLLSVREKPTVIRPSVVVVTSQIHYSKDRGFGS